MSPRYDLAIVGSGVTAATLAAALLAKEVVAPDRIVLLTERLPPPADPHLDIDLRVFALNRASQRLLTVAGIWPLLPADRVCPYERMSVWDTKSRGSLTFDCAEIGEPDLGHIVEGRALQWHAFQAVRKSQVAVIEAGIAKAAIDTKQALLGLSDGRELSARLIVAADGAGSALRAAFGIATSQHAYHQTALVTHVRTERPHLNTAWQRFLPTGPIALLPLQDGRSSMVWTLTQGESSLIGALGSDELSAQITRASGEILGRCEIAAPLARFPLQMQSAQNYVRERLCLVGDAAHTVHPLAGQGLNLGLADCAALVAALAGPYHERTDPRPEEWGDLRLLRRYERGRQTENLLLAGAFDGIERLFSNDNSVLTGLRGFGLSMVGRLPPLKRMLARRALGS